MQIGERVSAYRKRRGIPQEALAGLVGRSRTWLSQVERGIRDVDRLSTVVELANVLRVDVADLIGHDWRLAPNGAAEVQALDGIRRCLTGYSHLLGQEPRPWPLPQLRSAVVEVHRSYQEAKYERAARMLPDILRAADAYDGYNGSESREMHLTGCSVYTLTSKLLRKVNESHLAWMCADRAVHAAMAAGSRTAQGLAAYEVAGSLLHQDRLDEAERIAVRAAEQLMPHTASDFPETVSVAGYLWLLSAVMSGRRSDRAESRDRLATATQMADLLGRDGNHAWTAFGPTNVSIHTATVAAELGDPYEVLTAATNINTEAMPAELGGRRSRVHLDLAWAQTQARNDAEAVLHLQQADHVAPESLRYNAIAHEMIRELLKRSRRPLPALNTLAARAGVLA